MAQDRLQNLVSRTFPADRSAPACARRALDPLRAEIGDALSEDIRLLVSEVVTNSVLHGPNTVTSVVELRVWASDEVVRVAITDQGDGFERQDRPTGGERSGWGLMMVDRMSDRWGVDVGRGTEVWFEVRREGAGYAGAGAGCGV